MGIIGCVAYCFDVRSCSYHAESSNRIFRSPIVFLVCRCLFSLLDLWRYELVMDPPVRPVPPRLKCRPYSDLFVLRDCFGSVRGSSKIYPRLRTEKLGL